MKRLARFVELYPVLQQQAQTDGKQLATLVCVMTQVRQLAGRHSPEI